MTSQTPRRTKKLEGHISASRLDCTAPANRVSPGEQHGYFMFWLASYTLVKCVHLRNDVFPIGIHIAAEKWHLWLGYKIVKPRAMWPALNAMQEFKFAPAIIAIIRLSHYCWNFNYPNAPIFITSRRSPVYMYNILLERRAPPNSTWMASLVLLLLIYDYVLRQKFHLESA